MTDSIRLGTSETTTARVSVKITERIDLPVGEYVVHGNRRGQRVAAEHVTVTMHAFDGAAWGGAETHIVGRSIRADESLGAEQSNRVWTSRFGKPTVDQQIAAAAEEHVLAKHGTPADVIARRLADPS